MSLRRVSDVLKPCALQRWSLEKFEMGRYITAWKLASLDVHVEEHHHKLQVTSSATPSQRWQTFCIYWKWSNLKFCLRFEPTNLYIDIYDRFIRSLYWWWFVTSLVSVFPRALLIKIQFQILTFLSPSNRTMYCRVKSSTRSWSNFYSKMTDFLYLLKMK